MVLSASLADRVTYCVWVTLASEGSSRPIVSAALVAKAVLALTRHGRSVRSLSPADGISLEASGGLWVVCGFTRSSP